jgi:hypothetical protein
MMYRWLMMSILLMSGVLSAQTYSPLFSEVTLRKARQTTRSRLEERTIHETFSMPFNTENESRYQSAFWAVSQFHFDSPEVIEGFRKTIDGFRTAGLETRRSCLEAIHALNPGQVQSQLWDWLQREPHPKVFAMTALYLFRQRPELSKEIRQLTARRWPDYANHPILSPLTEQLSTTSMPLAGEPPPLSSVFRHQKASGTRNVYSFQRLDRSQPGMAIIQGGDGRFMRDSTGQLIVVTQLARSGSDLPFYITNGNTPQGIFRILGIGVSRNLYIGPTPNLQLLLPFEGYWSEYLLPEHQDSAHPEQAYLFPLPENWRSYPPIMEAFKAGRAGRTEIIAHGTTIDPEFFAGKPFYPISPTLGCLCAREVWDPETGRLKESDQLLLSETYLRADGRDGYLFVINLDDTRQPVTRKELEKLVEAYEQAQ